MKNFESFQLYRTTPKLSGNMKWDLIVSLNEEGKLEVTNFHIRPISNLIPYALISDDNILVRPHQLNIRDFYKETKSNFFNAVIDPSLDSDWPTIIPEYKSDEEVNYIKNYDDTYFAGAQRMNYNIYKKTHEILVPLWLEHVENSLTFKITIGSQTYDLEITPDPYSSRPRRKQSYSTKFGDYLFNYFNYLGLDEGNNNCMYVDFANKRCYFSGIDVQSGNLTTRNDNNITKNLISRERPLLEQNSIITNAFEDTRMILGQLMNFNIVLDINELGSYGTVSTDVYVDGTQIEKRDIFTNHYFVPRFETISIIDAIPEDQFIDNYFDVNALDYLNDYQNLDMMHKNKIVQPIVHWMPVETSHTLFNVYDGMGCYFYDNDKLNILSYQNGQQLGYIETEWSETLGNYIWTKSIPVINEASYINKLDKNYKSLIDLGILCPLLRHFGNDLKYDYEEGDENFYVGVAIYDQGYDRDAIYSSIEETENDVEKDEEGNYSRVISIWKQRYDCEGGVQTPASSGTKFITYEYYETLAPCGTKTYLLDEDESLINEIYKNGEIMSAYSAFYWENTPPGHDRMYDCTVNTDLNNRFGNVLICIDGDMDVPVNPGYSCKNFISRTDQAVTSKNTDFNYCYNALTYNGSSTIEQGPLIDSLTISMYKKGDKTYVLFTAEIMKIWISDTEEKIIKYPQQLMLGNIISTLQSYISYYRLKIYEAGDPDSFLEETAVLDDLDIIKEKLLKFSKYEIIYFNSSIQSRHDNALDKTTQEKNYYKTENTNHYVIRWSDSIRPAMFKFPYSALQFGQIGSGYYRNYGINYLWKKDTFKYDNMLNEASNNSDQQKRYIAYKKYAYSNIPPKYPSVDYDPVYRTPQIASQSVLTADRYKYNYGMLNYFNPPSNSTEEYKWFDVSYVRNFDINPQPTTMSVWINDKETLEEAVVEYYMIYFNQNITKTYLKEIYNIYYSLDNIEYFDNEEDASAALPNPVPGDDGKYIKYNYTIDLELK